MNKNIPLDFYLTITEEQLASFIQEFDLDFLELFHKPEDLDKVIHEFETSGFATIGFRLWCETDIEVERIRRKYAL